MQKNSKKEIASKIEQGFTILSQGESVFLADAVFGKKMRIKKAARPVILANGNHQKTVVSGALSHDDRQLFRQYEKFDQRSFVDCLKQIDKKFGRVVVFADRAPQHKSKITKQYLEDNPDVILEWFPKSSPQFNAVEEVWKQGKYNLLVSQYQPSLNNLKNNISKYYRTTRFHLDIRKYMQREDG